MFVVNNFSVIIPTYNRPEDLKNCLNSLINQKYEKNAYEIIIVDNSKEGTAENISEKYKLMSKVKIVFIHEKTPGLVFARHAGAIASKFDVLAFTDDDGILDENWLFEINNVINLNSKVAAVAGKIIIKWDATPPEWILSYEPLLGKLDYGDDVYFNSTLYVNGGNFIIKRNVLFELGGFNPDQIGEYLIGDGETGLNKKIWKNKMLIGWAPKAIMYHVQNVNKNATIKDICRRYYNGGVTDPFQLFTSNKKFKILRLVFQFLRSMLYVLFNIFLLFINPFNKKKSIFMICFYFSRAYYISKLFFSIKFRKMLIKRRWELINTGH